jgi:hypothetical protein
MAKRTASGRSPEELDIVSAIWVMANNDENNLITYQGIIHRLLLPSDYDVKGLISSRGELFRPGVQEWILNEWKSEMLGGKSLPIWIRDVKDKNEQVRMINRMTPDDVFRSQFRARKDAPQAELSVIDWGLQHIERLRKSRLESIDTRQKSIQLWIIIITSVINIFLTIANIVIASVSHGAP